MVEKNDIAIHDIIVITLGYNEAVIDITETSKFIYYVAYLYQIQGFYYYKIKSHYSLFHF
jgi:negative regulator of genetic competence, sporulation and motility